MDGVDESVRVRVIMLSPENEDGQAASSRGDQSAENDTRGKSETPDDQDTSETPRRMTDDRLRF